MRPLALGMRPLLLAGAAIALTLALGACAAVGPDYHVPDAAVVKTPAAQAPFIGTASGIATDAPLPGRWWHLYNDPVLDDLEQQALAANNDLRVAAANLEHAHAVSTGAEAGREPDVGMPVFPFGLSMGMILSAPMVLIGLGLILFSMLREPEGEPDPGAEMLPDADDAPLSAYPHSVLPTDWVQRVRRGDKARTVAGGDGAR